MQPLYEYVCHIKGHRNSKGELAEWVIKSHETGKILSSHKSEQKAKEHLQHMHLFRGEAVEGEVYPKLYHICGYMTGLSDDGLRDILTSGLRIHDNGEANAIWFSPGAPFSNNTSRAKLIVSLECTPENVKKYRINELDLQANSAHIHVHENVPIEDLNIEQLIWGITSHGEGSASHPLTSTRYYADFERWNRFDTDLQAIIYEDLFDLWAKDDIARQGYNPDLNRLKKIMGDRLTITNFMNKPVCSHCGWDGDGNLTEYNGRLLCPSCLKEFKRLDANRDANGNIKYHNITKRSDGFNPEGYKLIGESTYGNDMDKRIKIFMEGVSQLGLTPIQIDTIGKITNACMEGVGDAVDTQDIDPNMNKLDEYIDNPPETGDDTEENEEHELTMDEMYDKLIEQGVSEQTINIVTDIIGWNPDSMLKILDAATGYKSFDQLPEF